MITDITAARTFIEQIDLTGPENWIFTEGSMMPSTIAKAACAYRQYLFTVWKYHIESSDTPSQCARIDPGLLASDMWRAHVLHTESYYTACMGLLGRILHHVPNVPDDTHTRANTHRIDRMIPVELRFTPYWHPWFEIELPHRVRQ